MKYPHIVWFGVKKYSAPTEHISSEEDFEMIKGHVNRPIQDTYEVWREKWEKKNAERKAHLEEVIKENGYYIVIDKHPVSNIEERNKKLEEINESPHLLTIEEMKLK